MDSIQRKPRWRLAETSTHSYYFTSGLPFEMEAYIVRMETHMPQAGRGTEMEQKVTCSMPNALRLRDNEE
jgi:hypothetical protein